MIKIEFDGKHYELKVSGHANADAKGKDIVCASVSTLFYTLGETLFESTDMLFDVPTFTDSEEDDTHIIKCKPKPKYEANVQLVFRTILIGLKCLAESYKEYIEFKY